VYEELLNIKTQLEGKIQGLGNHIRLTRQIAD